MKKIILSTLIIAAMSSCSKETNPNAPEQGGLGEIRIGSGILAETKAVYNGDVAINDLQFLRKDAASFSDNDYTDAVAVIGNRAAGGAISFGNVQRYTPSDNTWFASYYPAGLVSNNVVTWTIDGKTDILTAATVDCGTNAAKKSTTLTYQHQLAQIEVICKASEAGNAVQNRWGNITGIKLRSTPSSLSMAYNGLGLTSGATDGNIALVAADYTTPFAAIAIPDNTNNVVNAAGMFYPSASQNFQLEVTTVTEGTKVITIDLGAGNKLERSKKHVVTLTFQKTSAEDAISVSSTVENWSNGATGSGSLN